MVLSIHAHVRSHLQWLEVSTDGAGGCGQPLRRGFNMGAQPLVGEANRQVQME
jgi:hypothetical protein